MSVGPKPRALFPEHGPAFGLCKGEAVPCRATDQGG